MKGVFFQVTKFNLLFLLQYCLIEQNNGVQQFKIATLQDIMKHRVIVVTLSISMNLSNIGLQKGNWWFLLL